MKNRLTDLNNVLFEQLDRLTDTNLSATTIELEIKRAETVVQVADKIVANAKLQLDACKLVAEHGDRFTKLLQPMLGAGAPAGNADREPTRVSKA
jgi:hypothetical protein